MLPCFQAELIAIVALHKHFSYDIKSKITSKGSPDLHWANQFAIIYYTSAVL